MKKVLLLIIAITTFNLSAITPINGWSFFKFGMSQSNVEAILYACGQKCNMLLFEEKNNEKLLINKHDYYLYDYKCTPMFKFIDDRLTAITFIDLDPSNYEAILTFISSYVNEKPWKYNDDQCTWKDENNNFISLILYKDKTECAVSIVEYKQDE